MNNIVGIGVDIVEISRVKTILERHGEHFLSRVFTEAETRYSMNSANAAEKLAADFAVKEAVLKALDVGKSSGITWKDIETVRSSSGKPVVRLYNQAMRRLEGKNGGAIHVSISHDGGKAIAFTIVERKAVEDQ
ncbi:MAG: holo-ACP synthase [Syntrophorhabdaceae bacterium]|nr:holo-ACP synthase [Syntrophorhabdaceae bacterium]